MTISYDRFIERLDSKGLSLNQLRLEKVISQYTYEAMINNEPVSLKWIDKLCQHFNVPIESVVEIKLESESPESDSLD